MTGGINMASNDLIIDDDYCKSMQTYFMTQGEQLDKLISDYVVILKGINSNAIVSGEVSKALGVYISYAQKLSEQFSDISSVAKIQINNFLTSVDNADQYLF